MPASTVTDLSPSQMTASLLIFSLGLLGLVLLVKFVSRAVGADRVSWCDASRRLALMPASIVPIWPLLVMLATGGLLALMQPGQTGADQHTPPSGFALAGAVLFQQGIMLTAVAACLVLAGRGWRDLLGAPARVSARQAIATGLRGGVMLLPPVWLLTFLSSVSLQRLGAPVEPQVTLQWLAGDSLDRFAQLFILLTAVVTAPIVEEVIFRGLLLPALTRRSARPIEGMLLSSLLFAAIHMHAPSLLPIGAIGIACSIGYGATRHLLTPIVMHAVFNAISLLAFYVRASGA